LIERLERESVKIERKREEEELGEEESYRLGARGEIEA
jgi:hypothetical protein